MKGIILHGGHGTRLRPLTHTGPKQLLPIANKPMSQFALEDMRNAGITDVGIIIGDVYPEKVKEYYGDGKKFGVEITYIRQDRPGGISHAIGLCRDFVGDEKFLVYLGDNILRKDLGSYVSRFSASPADSMILLCEVDDPSRFGIAELNERRDGIVRITEKPGEPRSNLAVIGVYFLTPKIFDIIDTLRPSRRGELEITDALQIVLERGSLEFDFVTGWWKDTGTAEDIIHANRLVLESIGSKNQFLIRDSRTEAGNVVLGGGTEVSPDSDLSGPLIVGKDCRIGPGVSLGPNVSIGDGCRLENCSISDSIIMEGCSISFDGEIRDSIVAQGSEIEHVEDGSSPKRLLLGERSRLRL